MPHVPAIVSLMIFYWLFGLDINSDPYPIKISTVTLIKPTALAIKRAVLVS